MEAFESIAAILLIVFAVCASKVSKAKKEEAARRTKAQRPAPPPPAAGSVPPGMNWEPYPEAEPVFEEGPYETREGHEECDPTEGSIEILGHSPEGLSMEMPEVKSAAPIVREEIAQARPRLTAQQLRQAVVMNEILGKPVSLRK